MGLSTVGKIVEEEWLRTPIIRPWVELDDYVVMPKVIGGEKTASLVKQIKKSKKGLKELKKDHINHLKSFHNILY